jgi:hypothetical protein
MRYVLVRWKHTDPAYPVELYSELDEASWEVRKVEIFLDGHRGYADRQANHGGTRLGLEPVPPLAEIGADPQFEPTEISQEDFERIWSGRTGD